MIWTAYLIGVALCTAIIILFTLKDRNVVRYWDDTEKFIMGWVFAIMICLSWFGVIALVAYSMLSLIRKEC